MNQVARPLFTAVRLVRCTKRNYVFLARQLTFGATNAKSSPQSHIECSSQAKHPTIVFQTRALKLPVGFPFADKRKNYKERRLLGYSMEQMYAVVAEVEKYKDFVPYCKSSIVKSRSVEQMKADLSIGFPPLMESYTSLVTMTPPHTIKSVCTDGKLFNHMLTIWKFSPGPANNPNSCWLDFYTSFEFRSALHSNLSSVFFDQVARQMVNAFLIEAKKRYGPASIVSQPSKFVGTLS